jgi:DNA-binding NarL/FixJ family response regulator
MLKFSYVVVLLIQCEDFIRMDRNIENYGEKSVLAIFFDNMSLTLIGDLIKSFGYNVTCAKSIDDVENLMQDGQSFDIVFTQLTQSASASATGNSVVDITSLRAFTKGTPVVILCSGSNPDKVQEAAGLGVSACILRSTSTTRIKHVFEIVMDGGTSFPKEMMFSDPVRVSEKVRSFSPDEAQLISHLAHGRSNKEIAFAMSTTEEKIKQSLRGVYEHLGTKNRTQTVIEAMDLNPSDFTNRLQSLFKEIA